MSKKTRAGPGGSDIKAGGVTEVIQQDSCLRLDGMEPMEPRPFISFNIA